MQVGELFCGRCGIKYSPENPRVGLAHCKWCQQEITLPVETLARLRARMIEIGETHDSTDDD